MNIYSFLQATWAYADFCILGFPRPHSSTLLPGKSHGRSQFPMNLEGWKVDSFSLSLHICVCIYRYRYRYMYIHIYLSICMYVCMCVCVRQSWSGDLGKLVFSLTPKPWESGTIYCNPQSGTREDQSLPGLFRPHQTGLCPLPPALLQGTTHMPTFPIHAYCQ